MYCTIHSFLALFVELGCPDFFFGPLQACCAQLVQTIGKIPYIVLFSVVYKILRVSLASYSQ